jgi:hypothetical protein
LKTLQAWTRRYPISTIAVRRQQIHLCFVVLQVNTALSGKNLEPLKGTSRADWEKKQ